ncbi:MAG: DUF488 family protein [Ktedonobacteraceae bacterium]
MEERINQLPIYTIGYGNRSIDECMRLLHYYVIEFLVDIRSQPYSRFHPDYSKAALESRLKREGLRYIFFGDTLGGRPADATCYINGKVDYAILREKLFYQQGITRLASARDKHARIVLLCSEQKPEECHRSKLIGNSLHAKGIEVAHIDESGQLKSQAEVDRVLTGGQLSLFDDPALNPKTGLSRKKYTPEGYPK